MILVKYEKSRTRKRKIAQHLNMKEMGEFIEMNSHTTSGKLSPHLPTSSCYQSREPPKFLFITKPKLYFTLCYFSFIFLNILFIANFEVTQNYSLIKALPSGFGAFAIWFFLDDPVSIFRWLIWQSQTATEFRPLHLIVSICPVHTAT